MSVVLTNLLNRKERLEDELRNVEKQVYDLETNYLHDSSANGNVIKGFEGFLSAANKTTNLKRARTFKTEDRLFSLSSLSSPAVEENLLGQVQDGLAGGSGYLPRSKSQTFQPSGGYMMTKPQTLKRSRLARETKRRVDDDDEDFEI